MLEKRSRARSPTAASSRSTPACSTRTACWWRSSSGSCSSRARTRASTAEGTSRARTSESGPAAVHGALLARNLRFRGRARQSLGCPATARVRSREHTETVPPDDATRSSAPGSRRSPRSPSRTRVHWCDGSAEEYDRLCQAARRRRHVRALSDAKRPNSLPRRWSDPATSPASRTAPSSAPSDEDDAGPTNNWRDPAEMRETLDGLFAGCDARPHDVRRAVLDGPARLGQVATSASQLTDSAYVAVSMRIMTRMGAGRARRARRRRRVRAVRAHGRRAARPRAQEDVPWPCNDDDKYIVHFPETREIWSYGSGYGGNALLGKKCFALRIASVMARDEGWMAEHMLILKLTSPEGEVKYVTGAFPSRVRQDQPRDADPDARGLEGRDGRRRHRLDEVRRRRPAVRDQPRGRLLRRRAGHGRARRTRTRWRRSRENTIFTNCALTDDGDIWWEGMTDEPPAHADRLARQRLDAASPSTPAAHPNARFTVPAAQDPAIAPEWEDPAGVPIDAFLFGGRRATVVPLVHEAFDWEHGVFLGATMAPRRPPPPPARSASCAATRSRCCRSAATTWPTTSRHWLKIGRARRRRSCRGSSTSTGSARTPTASSCGPASARTARVLEWIFRRCDGEAEAVETPIGVVPAAGRR